MLKDNAKSSPSMTISRLHNDELSWIFAFLDTHDFAASLKVARHWYSVAHLKSSWPQKFSLSDHIPAFHCADSSSPFLTPSSSPLRRLRISSKQLRQNLTHNSPYLNVRELDINASRVSLALGMKTFAQLIHLSSLTAVEVCVHESYFDTFVAAIQHDTIKERLLVLKCMAFSDQLNTFSQLRVLTLHSGNVDPTAIVQLHALEYFEGDDSHSKTSALVYALRYLSLHHSLRHLTLTDYDRETAAAFSHSYEELPVARLITLDFGEESEDRLLPSTVHSLCEIECLNRLKFYIVLGHARGYEPDKGDGDVSIGPYLSPKSESALRNISIIESLSLDITVVKGSLIHDLGIGLINWTSLRHLQITFDCCKRINLMQLLPSSGLPFLEELSICVEENSNYFYPHGFNVTEYEILASLPQLQRLNLDLPVTLKSKCLVTLLQSMKTLQHFDRLDITVNCQEEETQFLLPAVLNAATEMVKFASLHIHLRGMDYRFEVDKWWNRIVDMSSTTDSKLARSAQTSPRVEQFRVFVHTSKKDVTFVYRVDCTHEEVKWIDCTNERRNRSNRSLTQLRNVADVPAPRLVGIELNPGPPRRAAAATISNFTAVASSSRQFTSKKKRTRGVRDKNSEKEVGKLANEESEQTDGATGDSIMKLEDATSPRARKRTKHAITNAGSRSSMSKSKTLEGNNKAIIASSGMTGSTHVPSIQLPNDALSSIFAFLNANDFACSFVVSRQWYLAAQMKSSWPQTFALADHIPTFHSLGTDALSTIVSSLSLRRLRISGERFQHFAQSAVYSHVRDLNIGQSKTSKESFADLTQLSSLTVLQVSFYEHFSDALLTALESSSMKERLRVFKWFLSTRDPFPSMTLAGLVQLRVLVLRSPIDSTALVHLHALEYFEGDDLHSATPELIYTLRYLSVHHSLRHLTLTDYSGHTAAAFSQPVSRSFDGRPIEDLPVAHLLTVDFGERSEGVHQTVVHELCEMEGLKRLLFYPLLGQNDDTIGMYLFPSSAKALKTIAGVEWLSLEIYIDANYATLTHDLGAGLARWISLRYLRISFNYQNECNFVRIIPTRGLSQLEALFIEISEKSIDEGFQSKTLDLCGLDALTLLPSLRQLSLQLPSGQFKTQYLSSLLQTMKTLQHFERLDITVYRADVDFHVTSTLFELIGQMSKFQSLHIHLPRTDSKWNAQYRWNRIVNLSGREKLARSVTALPRVQQFRIFMHPPNTSTSADPEKRPRQLPFIYKVDCTSEELNWIECSNG